MCTYQFYLFGKLIYAFMSINYLLLLPLAHVRLLSFIFLYGVAYLATFFFLFGVRKIFIILAFP